MLPASRRIASSVRPRPRHNSTLLSPFPPSVSSHLQTHGYAIFDNAVPSSTSAALRSEIHHLFISGHLQPNATHIVSSSSTSSSTFTKRNVLEAEFAQLFPSTLTALPTLSTLASDPTVRALLSVHAPIFTLSSHALKVQRALGDSACFPVHVDSAPNVDARVITALLYLNEAWDAREHGGALRIYNSPTTAVDIAPNDARLVLLAATGMHHRVLPAFKTRYVITMWCSGELRKRRAKKEAVAEGAGVEERAADKLLDPRFRDMAFRLLLVDEWERSLWEAHPRDNARKAVELHRNNLALIRERLPKALCRELAVEGALEKVKRLVQEPHRLENVFRDLESRDPAALAFRW